MVGFTVQQDFQFHWKAFVIKYVICAQWWNNLYKPVFWHSEFLFSDKWIVACLYLLVLQVFLFFQSWKCNQCDTCIEECGSVIWAPSNRNSRKSMTVSSTEQCYPTLCFTRTHSFMLVESLAPPKFLPISSTPQPERRQPPQRRHSIEKETPTNVRQFLPPSKQSSRSLVSGVGGRREKKRHAKSIMKIKTWLQCD